MVGSTDTIIALTTPNGFSGIAVIRVNGPGALEITSQLCTPDGNPAVTRYKPRTATLSTIFINQQPLDEVLITYFKAPASYTGDDLVEISSHGNPLIVETIITAACDFGARIAAPGEFSLRAFINGRLDLVQAESIAGLIKARSIKSSRLNYRLLQGGLSQRLTDLRNSFISLLSEIEFELDISEDNLNPNVASRTQKKLLELIKSVQVLVESYRVGRLINRGINVVIVGAPNVGKSTILNALTDSDRAIVSAVPGTTRDSIDVNLVLEGFPVSLIDTAGLHESSDAIEQEGIRRTRQQIEKADLILAVYDIGFIDSSKAYSLPDNTPVIDVLNKIDTRPAFILNNKSADSPVLTCAITRAGIDLLKKRIVSKLSLNTDNTADILLTTARQYTILSRCHNSIQNALELLLKPDSPFDLIAIEVRDAVSSVDELLGKTTADDILNHIFGRFCVGK